MPRPQHFGSNFEKLCEAQRSVRGGEWRPGGSLAQPRAKPGQTLSHSVRGKTPGSGPLWGRPHGVASSTRPWSQRPPGLYSPAPSRPSCDPTHKCPGTQAPVSRLTRGTQDTSPSPGPGSALPRGARPSERPPGRSPDPPAPAVTSQAVARLHAEHRQGAGARAVVLAEARAENVLDLPQVLQLPVRPRLGAPLQRGGRRRGQGQLGAGGGHGAGAAVGSGTAGKAARPPAGASFPTAFARSAPPLPGG